MRSGQLDALASFPLKIPGRCLQWGPLLKRHPRHLDNPLIPEFFLSKELVLHGPAPVPLPWGVLQILLWPQDYWGASAPR